MFIYITLGSRNIFGGLPLPPSQLLPTLPDVDYISLSVKKRKLIGHDVSFQTGYLIRLFVKFGFFVPLENF